MAHHPLNASLRSLPQILLFFVVTATVVILYWAQAVFIPVALSVLFTFVLSPLVTYLERRSIGRVPAVIIVVSAASALFILLFGLVAFQLNSLANDLPQYTNNIREKLLVLRQSSNGGVVDKLRNTLDQALDTPVSDSGDDSSNDTSPNPPPLTVRILPDSKSDQAIGTLIASIVALSPAMEVVATGGFVVILVIFMLFQREDLRNRMVSLTTNTDVATTTRALNDAGRRISRYLMMQLLINVSFGMAAGLGLLLIGVPYALLWGLCAAVFRYIPFLGSFIAALLPLTVSLITSPSWTQVLLVLALFLVLELIANNVMEPWLYGQGIGISMVALIVSAAFWTWMWGAIGLILATPLTVCLIVVGKYVPSLSFLNRLLGDTPALAPHTALFQRLLANDVREAASIAKQFQEEHPAERIYDDLLVPVLAMGRQARRRGTVSAIEETNLLSAIRQIVTSLAADGSLTVGSPPVSTQSNILSAGCEGGRRMIVPNLQTASSMDELGEPVCNRVEEEVAVSGSTPAPQILGCTAHHETEELTLQMLTNLYSGMKVQSTVLSTRQLPTDIVDRVRKDNPTVVVIAVMPPGGMEQARYLCRLLRKRFPRLAIVVGCWGFKGNLDQAVSKFRAVGVHYVTTTLVAARDHAVALANVPRTETAILKNNQTDEVDAIPS